MYNFTFGTTTYAISCRDSVSPRHAYDVEAPYRDSASPKDVRIWLRTIQLTKSKCRNLYTT